MNKPIEMESIYSKIKESRIHQDYQTYQFLADVGLDKVDPLRNLHLATLLEVGGQGDCEVLLAHVLNTD